MMCRCVWSRNLKNEEGVSRIGLQRHKEKRIISLQISVYGH